MIMGLSSAVIIILSALVIYLTSQDYILKRAEEESVSISQALFSLNRNGFNYFFGNNDFVDSNNINYKWLDEDVRSFLIPFHVIKIKVFSTDSIIMYSTETSIIGKSNRKNLRLEKALSGYSSSQLKNKGEALDLALETRFDIDVVGTYVPIYSASKEIVGVLEIYQDVTRFRDDITRAVFYGTLVVLLILLSAFFISFKVTKLPMRKLELVQNRLKNLASIDSLTSVYNRHQIINKLKMEVDRTIRGCGKLSIILVDLDHFKKINDRYGHLAGDYVLKEVAKSINENVRSYDSVGRYGGEEFLILLPGLNRSYAIKNAERIRSKIENMTLEYNSNVIPVSFSAGVSEFILSDSNIEEVIMRADDALYFAKRNGRNRVASDLEAHEST